MGCSSLRSGFNLERKYDVRKELAAPANVKWCYKGRNQRGVTRNTLESVPGHHVQIAPREPFRLPEVAMHSLLKFPLFAGVLATQAIVPNQQPKPPAGLYVSALERGVQAFPLPLQPSAHGPVVLQVRNGAAGMGFDRSGDLYVADTSAAAFERFHWKCRPQPHVGAKPDPICGWTAIAVVATEKPAEDVAVDGQGTAYVSESTNDAVEVFRAPVSTGSHAAFKLAFPDDDTPNGVALDGSGNLYVAETKRILEYMAPIGPGSQPRTLLTLNTGKKPDEANGPLSRGFASGIAVAGPAIFVSQGIPKSQGGVAVFLYLPPFIAKSLPAATFQFPDEGVTPETMTLDASGTLYVAVQYGSGSGLGGVYEFRPPFVGLKSPSAFVPIDSEGATGVAIPGGAERMPIVLGTPLRLPLYPLPTPLPVLPPPNTLPNLKPKVAAPPMGSPSTTIYTGRIELRFPRMAVEKEFTQATRLAETAGLTDSRSRYSVLSKRENRYLVRQLCWVLTIQRHPDVHPPAAPPGEVRSPGGVDSSHAESHGYRFSHRGEGADRPAGDVQWADATHCHLRPNLSLSNVKPVLINPVRRG